MTDPSEREVAVFSVARRLAGATRATYLDETCAADPTLRQRIEELLEASEEAGRFLQHATPGAQRPLDAITCPNPGAPAEKVGDRIGRYKLLQQIGEGGCGVVYMAEQEEPVHRRVALKVIKLGMDTKQVIARFEAERQALALMDHPNIAKVLDGGSTQAGRPYFVMELVRGVKITDYCDESQLPTPERLGLFIKVCHAIQHAHQNRALEDLEAARLRSAFPERPARWSTAESQASDPQSLRLRADLLNTVADAFELTGNLDEAVARFQECLALRKGVVGDNRGDVTFTLKRLDLVLAKLVSRLSAQGKLADAESRAREALSITRESTPNDTALLRKNLTQLGSVLRQERKYDEAESFFHEAITIASQPATDEPSLLDRPLLELGFVLEDRGRAAEAETLAREAVAKARASSTNNNARLESLLSALGNALRWQKKYTEAEIPYREALTIARKLATNDLSRLELRISDLGSVLRLQGKPSEAVLLLREAGEGVHQLGARDPSRLELWCVELGNALRDQNKLAEAEPYLREAVAMARQFPGRDPPRLDIRLADLGGVLRAQGRYAEAEGIFREAAASARQFSTNDPARLQGYARDIADVLQRQGKPTEAETVLRDALEEQRNLLGVEHPAIARSLADLANWLSAQGKLAETESTRRELLALQRRLFGNDYPETAGSLHALGDLLSQKGQLIEAEACFREALEIRRRLSGNEDLNTAGSKHNLADVLRREGKLAEAESLYREALATRRKLLGSEDPNTVGSRRNLTDLLGDQGRWSEVESLVRDELATARQTAPHDPSSWTALLTELAEILQRQGKKDALQELFNDLPPASSPGQPPSVSLLDARAQFFARHGRWKEAAADLAQEVELDPTNHWNYHCLAPLLARVAEIDRYRALRQRMVVQFRGTADPNIAERMAKASLILPNSGADLPALGTWVELALTRGKDSADFPWFQSVKGLAEYRQGHFAEAMDWMQKVLSHAGDFFERDAGAYAVKAMAHQQLKQAKEARTALAKALEIADTHLPKLDTGDLGGAWVDWIIAHVLLDEAKSLIEGQRVERKD